MKKGSGRYQCSACGAAGVRVYQSKHVDGCVHRYRKCPACGVNSTTIEIDKKELASRIEDRAIARIPHLLRELAELWLERH